MHSGSVSVAAAVADLNTTTPGVSSRVKWLQKFVSDLTVKLLRGCESLGLASKTAFFRTIWMKLTLMSGFCKKSWKLKLLSVGRLVIIACVRLSSLLLCLQDRFLGFF